MVEPTTIVIVAAGAGASLLALVPGTDASTVLGAFAGASIFAMSCHELGAVKKLIFLILAFVAGLISAPTSAELLSALLPQHVQVSLAVGALIASALEIKVLTRLLARAENPATLLANLKSGKE